MPLSFTRSVRKIFIYTIIEPDFVKLETIMIPLDEVSNSHTKVERFYHTLAASWTIYL